MIIGVDFRLANKSHRGMARYCREIIKELLRMDLSNRYILYIDSEPTLDLGNGNYVYSKIESGNFILGEQIYLHKHIKKDKCDIFWSPYNTFPIFTPKHTKLLATVHDVIFLYPFEKGISVYQRIGALYRRYVLKYFHKKVAGFFTVSQYSKKELLRLLPIKVPVEITYNCIDKFADKVSDKIKTNNRNYFFTLSGDGPNKNLDTLLCLFEKEFVTETLIVGGVSKNSKYRKRECSNIHFLPYGISDNKLIEAYLNSKCFLFFSKYEGFGIPLIEAAICGKPILASNTTSIPEILGNFGKTCSPVFHDMKALISDFILNPHPGEIDYSPLINRFNNWEIPAKTILNYINKL